MIHTATDIESLLEVRILRIVPLVTWGSDVSKTLLNLIKLQMEKQIT